jgi:hypothetical protein
MTITTLIKSGAAAASAALALAGTATASGPIISAGTGCAVQCITKALVTPTTTTAKVELATTVTAHLTVSIAKQTSGTTTGGFVAPSWKTVSISAFSPSKTAWFSGLEPETTYAIVVKATDLKGQKASQQGTFETLEVETTGQAGPGQLDSGLGCAAQCIERALFTQTKPAASVANVDIETSTDAKVQIIVSRDEPVPTAVGPSQWDVVSSQTSPGLVRSWKTQVGGLRPATRYYVVVRAKDAQDRVAIQQGSFRTVRAHAVVTIHKLKIVNDGDKGRNRGELYFAYRGNGHEFANSGGFEKLGSGSVVSANVAFDLPVNASGMLSVVVAATECDALLKKNCVVEAGPGGDALAGGKLDLWQVLDGGALPPWYGTGVQAPAGHDGYVVLATGDTYVRFLALATIDLKFDWPS